MGQWRTIQDRLEMRDRIVCSHSKTVEERGGKLEQCQPKDCRGLVFKSLYYVTD